MARNIFISYKYGDSSVYQMDNCYQSGLTYQSFLSYAPKTARTYVDILQKRLAGVKINKGELDGEDLSHFKDSTIRSHLSDKIFDSSITVVLLSPRMNDVWKPEADQWIPWEIYYSLRKKTRLSSTGERRISKRNGLVFVALPDAGGVYDYLATNHCFYPRSNEWSNSLFHIIRANLSPWPGVDGRDGDHLGYAVFCTWCDFLNNPLGYLDEAERRRLDENKYEHSLNITG